MKSNIVGFPKIINTNSIIRILSVKCHQKGFKSKKRKTFKFSIFVESARNTYHQHQKHFPVGLRSVPLESWVIWLNANRPARLLVSNINAPFPGNVHFEEPKTITKKIENGKYSWKNEREVNIYALNIRGANYIWKLVFIRPDLKPRFTVGVSV